MIRFWVGVLCIFLFFTNGVSAVSDDFIVELTIGSDVTAPTIPTPVTATAIATTQIDITWGASTDDVSLSGYRLFRDSVQIATTALLTYSDTGLSASTTYSYTVQAYDWLFNISTTSSTSTATTLSPSVTPSQTATSSSGTRQKPRLTTLDIQTDEHSASFSWGTNIYTQYILRWGNSSEYDLGSLQNAVYSRTHATYVQGLESETQYMYELIGINQRGREFLLKRGVFTTQEEKDITAPANVSNIRTVVESASVYLQWTNPLEPDFTKVRVVRNYLFYPKDPVDGFIVYEGSAQSVFDAGVLITYPGQYYTIFAYDDAGNISSGTVVYVRSEEDTAGVDTTSDGNTGTIGDTTPPTDVRDLHFSDVRFIQSEELLEQGNERVIIDSEVPLGIQLPSELLPDHLKTIVVTFTDTYGDTQSYILRNNDEKTMYEALLRNLSEGLYEVSFSVYDYQTQLQTTFDGQVVSQKWISSSAVNSDTERSTSTITYSLVLGYVLVSGLLLLILFVVWFFFTTRRSREDN